MAKILIARGQATIYVQKDGYTITQSLGEYVFPADDTVKILSSVTLTSTVRVMCGDEELTAYTSVRWVSRRDSHPLPSITARRP